MSPEQRHWSTDEIIREAVRQELEEIQAPPPEQAWQSLRERLAEQQQPARRPFSFASWSRYAAVAAACLLLVLGGLGIYRGLHFASPGPDDLLVMDAAEHEAAEIERGAAGQLTEYGWTFLNVEPAPDDWPYSINGFAKTRLFSLTLDPGKELLAVEYDRNGDSLFWIRAEPPVSDISQFVDRLQEALADPVTVTGAQDGLLYLSIGEQPGLAWPDPADGSLQVLWAPDGAVTEKTLSELAHSLTN